jgi:hypothetical protein
LFRIQEELLSLPLPGLLLIRLLLGQKQLDSCDAKAFWNRRTIESTT